MLVMEHHLYPTSLLLAALGLNFYSSFTEHYLPFFKHKMQVNRPFKQQKVHQVM